MVEQIVRVVMGGTGRGLRSGKGTGLERGSLTTNGARANMGKGREIGNVR